MNEQLTDVEIDAIIVDMQRAISHLSGAIQVLKKQKEEYLMRKKKEDWNAIYKKIVSQEIDTWEDWDNRIACPLFDMMVIGCLYCEHYDMRIDTQSLSCPLELDLHRLKE